MEKIVETIVKKFVQKNCEKIVQNLWENIVQKIVKNQKSTRIWVEIAWKFISSLLLRLNVVDRMCLVSLD